MKISLGTAQFGLDYGITNKVGKTSGVEARSIIELSRSYKVDTIDTAIEYGKSEVVLGNIGVSDFKVITKLPPLDYSTDSSALQGIVFNHVRSSICRLSIPALYGLLLHRPSDLIGDSSGLLIDALLKLKNQQLIKKIGISIYSPDELALLYEYNFIDIVQVPLNIFDRRLVMTGWLDKLHSKGIEVHTRSVFLQGLLLSKRNHVPKKFDKWSSLWSSYFDFIESNKLDPVSLCLAYPMSFDKISKIVVGVTNIHQYLEILSYRIRENNFCWSEVPFSNDVELIEPYRWNTL